MQSYLETKVSGLKNTSPVSKGLGLRPRPDSVARLWKIHAFCYILLLDTVQYSFHLCSVDAC